jgi:hypothetical protein
MVNASDAVIAHKNEIQRSLPARHYDMTRADNVLDHRFTDVADAIAQILKKFQDGTSPFPTVKGSDADPSRHRTQDEGGPWRQR